MRDALVLLSLVLLISFSECLGQSCLKKYSLTPASHWLYWLGVVFYAMVCLLLVFSYKYRGMGIINILWSGLSVLTIVTVGIFFFDEKLTALDWTGILLVLLGIACIVYEGEH
jgi:multidrug transporter EmrE-like cation transporter